MVTKVLIQNNTRHLLVRVKEFLNVANSEFDVEKAYLFGSTAKGKRHSESDVDLIIVSSSFRKVHPLKRLEKLLGHWHYIEELEILAYTPEEFDQIRNRLLMKEILSYAIDLTPE